MIINHNISAINAHRQLGVNQNGVQGSLEKLSSGLQINRAGDDAAGLAISEKMRGQIRGLEQASTNAQDGISLIQTAEGALNETHDILQRMRELAVKSANDTNTTEQDRKEIQKEVTQLAQAINDISDDTEFNTKKLLDGQFSGKFHVGANAGQSISLEIGKMDSEALKVTGYTGAAVDVEGVTGATVSNNTGEEITIKYAAAQTDDDNAAITETTAELSEDGKTVTITLAQEAGDGSQDGVGDITATHQDVVDALKGIGSITVETGDTFSGSTAATVQTDDTTVTAGVIDRDKGIDVSSQKAADAAITTIQTAIDNVSAQRSDLGSVQNRLEHTINNLGASAENLTAAESRIRDVDYDLAA